MAPVVVVDGCTITGTQTTSSNRYPHNVDVFYGIPYARTARFRPAVLTAFINGTSLLADQAGTSQPFFMAPTATAENPLTLNVFRPSPASDTTDKAKLPVLIYFHGGAFNFGDPLERDLSSLVAWTASAGNKMVVVSISYRLGTLGFLSGGEEAENLNLGLKDQVVAMEWVKRYVGAFGGDVNNITAMGTSAGAHSIGHHILRPGGHRPFIKAILESGSPTARSVLSPTHPRVLSNYTSLKSHISSARRSTTSTNPPLNTTPLAPLLEAAMTVWVENAANVTWPFQPVVEAASPSAIIPNTPLQLWDSFDASSLSSASTLPLSVITGFNSHEGTQFVPQKATTNADFRDFFAQLLPSLTAHDLDTLETLYVDPVAYPDTSPYVLPQYARQGDQFYRLHHAYAHYAYICPVLHTAHRLSSSSPDAHVYVYEFAALAEPFRAASHGDQAPIVAHDVLFLNNRPGLTAVADEMTSRWGAFAASQDGSLSRDQWPRFVTPFEADVSKDIKLKNGHESLGKILVFGQGNDENAGGQEKGTPVMTRTLSTLEVEQCKFWWKRMPLSQGMGEMAN